MDKGAEKKILRVLNGEIQKKPPIWLMRQAGRYLPEYRELRATEPSFMDFCFNPKKASEATLQPIRRFGFDAAILFCDILVIPNALGQKVSFETGEGPRLNPIEDISDFQKLYERLDMNQLSTVFEAIERVKEKLPEDTALLGFCGAPWTVASYMIAGKGTPDQGPARLFAYRNPDLFQKLIEKIVDASIIYLIAQFQAGVDAVQIFDSWSGVLPGSEFQKWCFEPLKTIVDGVKAKIPEAPIIAFPRAATSHLQEIASLQGISAIGLDTSTDVRWAKRNLPTEIVVQGNLDPLALIAGGRSLDLSVDSINEAFSNRPHIFNLGHGILPQTPISHVEQLVARIRGA